MAKYQLLLDYNLYVAQYFKLFKKGEFYVNAGLSMMNRNSDFGTKEIRSVGDSEFTISTISDFNYFANKLPLRYRNGPGSVYLGMYTTQVTPYFDKTIRFNIPFMGCSFNLGKL